MPVPARSRPARSSCRCRPRRSAAPGSVRRRIGGGRRPAREYWPSPGAWRARRRRTPAQRRASPGGVRPGRACCARRRPHRCTRRARSRGRRTGSAWVYIPPEVTNTTRPASARSDGSSSSVISTGPSTCSAIVISWPWADVVRVSGSAPALCTRARSGSPDATNAARTTHRVQVGHVADPDPCRPRPADGAVDLGGDPATTAGVTHHKVHGGAQGREVERGAPAQPGRRPGHGDVPTGQGPATGSPARSAGDGARRTRPG